MKNRLFHNLFALALALGVLAGYAGAASAQGAGTTDKSALIDESDAPAAKAAAPEAQAQPAADPKAGAQQPASSEKQTAKAAPAPSKCEHAAPEKKSDIPIFPIVLSSIGTIAFIVLAIIF